MKKKTSEKYHMAYLGFDHDRACDVIWNIIDVSSLSIENKNKLLDEFSRIKQLKHENILVINDFWLKESGDKLIYITDYLTGGSIRQFLRRLGCSQKLKVIKSWIKMILKGLKYLHSHGLIFRDLNCGRLNYESKTAHIGIGDIFISSKVFYECFENSETDMFSINYLSPEIINKGIITEKNRYLFFGYDNPRDDYS